MTRRNRRTERGRDVAASRIEPARETETTERAIDAVGHRAGLIIIQRALREGWAIPPHVLQSLPALVTEMATGAESDRDRLRAVETLLAMQRANLDSLVAADKCERLDGGGATERLELAPITLRPGGAGS
jgi:hypothetical protein